MSKSAITPLDQSWRVVEIFGPTIQGEGVDQGVACDFVRFGGCDFKCVWCDTPHAVLPDQVRLANRLTSREICERLEDLHDDTRPPWVILSGGNPCLHELGSLVDKLHEMGYLVAVETQGSKWREWLRKVDRLCVSPKPPSAGQRYDWMETQRFLQEGMLAKLDEMKGYEWMFLKVVIFNEDDLDFAEKVHSQLSSALLYLSAGNDAGKTVGNPEREDKRSIEEVKLGLLERSEWLVEEIFRRPNLMAPDVLVQSQYHVLLWGNALGR